MSVMMVRQNVKHGSIEEAEAAVRALSRRSIACVPGVCATRRRG